MKFYSDDGYEAPDFHGRNKDKSNGLVCEHVYAYKEHNIALAFQRISKNCFNFLDGLRYESLTSNNRKNK